MQSSLSERLKWSERIASRVKQIPASLVEVVFNRRLQFPLSLPWGPVTRRRLWRTLLIYFGIFVVAFLLQEFSDSQRVQAFATGLMAPHRI